jgi:hypothetical protein
VLLDPDAVPGAVDEAIAEATGFDDAARRGVDLSTTTFCADAGENTKSAADAALIPTSRLVARPRIPAPFSGDSRLSRPGGNT